MITKGKSPYGYENAVLRGDHVHCLGSCVLQEKIQQCGQVVIVTEDAMLGFLTRSHDGCVGASRGSTMLLRGTFTNTGCALQSNWRFMAARMGAFSIAL